MRALYLETSAVMRAYVHGDREVHAALHAARRDRRMFTSALTAVEVRRAMAKLAHDGRVEREFAADLMQRVLRFLAGADEVPLSASILARAGGTFSQPLRTLDALHVATAAELQAVSRVTEVVMASRDARVRANAADLGMQLA